MYKRVAQGWLKHLDFMVLDLISLQLAYFIAYVLRHGMLNPYSQRMYRNVALLMILTDIVVTSLFSTLKNVLKRGYYQELAATGKQVCLVELIVAFYLFVTQDGGAYSRVVLLVTGAFYLVFSYTFRIIWKRVLPRIWSGAGKRSLMIVTVSGMIDEVLENIRNRNYEMFYLSGIAVLDRDMTGTSFGEISVVADKKTVADYVCREWVDEVFMNLPEDEPEPRRLLEQLAQMGVVVHTRLAKSENLIGRKQFVERFGRYTVLTTSINWATPGQAFLKRALDIAGGLAGCLITLMLYVILAPMIKRESPGPVFFSQERVGKGGKRFKIYKFRSMYLDAENRKKELMAQNRVSDGMMFKLDWDPRIIGSKKLPDGTRKKGVGNYIRDWSLDEFPQFFNVLKGDMSLVGTRPPTVDEWEKYDLHHRARLAIRPGVTGMWQVSGRSNITDFEDVVRLDTQYISEWSFGLDLRILLKTVLVVFKKEGSM